ncbi:MAG: hypothetical protein ABIO35_00790 [Nitrobacter sp.]
MSSLDRMFRAQRPCRFGRSAGLAAELMARVTTLAAALVALSSCSILPKAEILEIYQLSPVSIAPSALPHSLPWTLRIATPHKQPAYRQRPGAGAAAK